VGLYIGAYAIGMSGDPALAGGRSFSGRFSSARSFEITVADATDIMKIDSKRSRFH
jgi:hypothetical protein